MTLESTIITLQPYIWALIFIGGGLFAYKIRMSYKKDELKEISKELKKEATLEGGINKMLKSAPDNLKQINSEIATIEEKCLRENIPEKTKNELLSRLNQEKDLLSYAVKYGDVVKPFIKPIDKILNGWLGKLGGK